MNLVRGCKYYDYWTLVQDQYASLLIPIMEKQEITDREEEKEFVENIFKFILDNFKREDADFVALKKFMTERLSFNRESNVLKESFQNYLKNNGRDSNLYLIKYIHQVWGCEVNLNGISEINLNKMNEKILNEIEEKINKDGACLCYVWNDEQNNPNKRIMIVKEVNRLNAPCYFSDGWSCVYYRNAEPVKDDIKKYII